MILSGAKIHSSSDQALGCRSQHLRGRTEVRLVVDEFWSETVCADAASAHKAAGLVTIQVSRRAVTVSGDVGRTLWA